jgi:hypothetical protein
MFYLTENKRLLQEAKLELKKSKRKDYYKILGVSKTATEDEIKKHYRKRALVHHPGKLVQLALCHMWSICFVWGEGIERRRCSIKHYIVLTSAIGTIVVVIVW